MAITAIEATITVQQTCRRLSRRFMAVSYSMFHLRFIAPEAVCSDGYRLSEVFIADIAELYIYILIYLTSDRSLKGPRRRAYTL
jgi:hypothetical protein